MKKISVVLSDGQIETIKKVLAFEELGPVDLKSCELVCISDVMVLTISRLAWLYSHELSRVDITRILDFQDDVLHDLCSESSRLKSNKIIDHVK